MPDEEPAKNSAQQPDAMPGKASPPVGQPDAMPGKASPPVGQPDAMPGKASQPVKLPSSIPFPVRAIKFSIKLYSKTVGPYMPKSAKRVLRALFLLAGFNKVLAPAAEANVRNFYASSGIISPGDLVFDVGAHYGTFAQALLDLGARVVCIEPDPGCLKILHSKYDGNKNVAIVEAGLSDKDGELELFIGENSGISTFSGDFKSMEEKQYGQDYVNKVKVKVTTLDALISLHGMPKYCKIDVEGFERQVLCGLGKKIPYISFEFHKEMLQEAKECAKALSRLGDAEFNFTHYDPSRPPSFDGKWADCAGIFSQIENEPKSVMDGTGDINVFRTGDIYARFK